jgi:hypothetical protein
MLTYADVCWRMPAYMSVPAQVAERAADLIKEALAGSSSSS